MRNLRTGVIIFLLAIHGGIALAEDSLNAKLLGAWLLVALSFVAAATRTLKLATGVALLPQRDPIITAKSAASLDHLSGGRFIFAVRGRRVKCRGNGKPSRAHTAQSAGCKP